MTASMLTVLLMGVLAVGRLICHNGKMGDAIYAMCGMKLVAETDGEPVDVWLLRGDGGGQGFTDQELSAIIPLFQSQDYVGTVTTSRDRPADIDFTDWYHEYRDFERCILETTLDFLESRHNIPMPCSLSPWLRIAEPVPRDVTLVNRGGNYPNDTVDWPRILEEFAPVEFLGTEEGHLKFCAHAGREIPRLNTNDLHEAARYIAGCRHLVCDQSAPLAIAAGIGRDVTVETSPEHLDCIIRHPGADYRGVDEDVLRQHACAIAWQS